MTRRTPLLLALALAACGDRPPPGSAPAPGPVPAATLARLAEEARRRAAEDPEGAGPLVAALEDVAAGRSPPGSEARQVAVTAWLGDAVDGGRTEEALEAWGVLEREHDGAARFPDGTTSARGAVAAGLLEAAAEAGRRRLEGPDPDAEAAARAFAAAEAFARSARDAEAEEALARARRWTGLWGAEAIADLMAPHEGPRVVVFADDFALGEPVLPSVLARWAAQARLRVGVVAVRGGFVREGARRRPATPAEERDRVAARLAGGAVALEPGGIAAAEADARLGLPAGWTGILVLDGAGRVAARLSGAVLDPRPLEPAVQRAASR